MSSQDTINQLFNNNSKAFTEATEQQYKAGTYKRGEVFLKHISALIKSPDAAVLDYGCGTGRISMMLGKQGYQVLGVDPAVDHIQIAGSLNDSPRIVFKVLTQEPIAAPASFDAIVSSSVFEFVPDAQEYIASIYQLLKPGGLLFMSFPNTHSLWRLYSKLRFGKRYQHFKFQKNTFTPKQVTALLEKNNFKKIAGPEYYESAFDQKGLSFLNTSRLFGTLFILVLEKK
jgi:2-polyprenyl-3-methyl-5-hydroxy-6-metoxy-1,4-benzoquinol methylase